ncbi:hypothetical protein BANRA_00024 [Klebsiella pneumoniae]|nr:hypothetical protein BANRA_00024 [Klebsiella pneumoniae]
MVQTIFAGAADADERPGNMLKIDRKIFAAEMQIGMMGAVPRAATSLAKSAQRASLTSAVGSAYQKTSICAPKALAKPAAISLTRALTRCCTSLLWCAASSSSTLSGSTFRYCLRIRVTLSTTESRVLTSRLATLCSTVTSWLASRIASFLHVGGRHAPLPGHFEDEAVDVGERAAAGGNSPTGRPGSLCMPKIADTSSSAPARIRVSPAKIFLRRLKQDPHPPREFRFPLLQQQRRPSITLV